jgi:hypothetical protein
MWARRARRGAEEINPHRSAGHDQTRFLRAAFRSPFQMPPSLRPLPVGSRPNLNVAPPSWRLFAGWKPALHPRLGQYHLGSRQSRGKSGSAACCAESLWLSGADSPPPSPRLDWKAQPCSRAGGVVRAEALGKAKPFRTAGGRAALGCYLSGTLTGPCSTTGWL